MPGMTKKYLENIFRNSNSQDELFDTFRITIDKKIKDPALYKILLWNKALSPDEVMMYAEKICKEYPELSYQLFSWVGKIFSSISVYGEHHDNALVYLKKAAWSNPSAHEPYLSIAKLYNADLNLPHLDTVIKIIEKGLETVDKKSKLCFAIAFLCKSANNNEVAKSYQKLGEKYQKEGK